MHSVVDKFYPSRNSISEVMHSYALYVHLGRRPRGFFVVVVVGFFFFF